MIFKKNWFILPFSLISLMLIKVASLFKVSFILGSFKAFFSASSIIVPLVGYYAGVVGTGLIVGASIIMRGFLLDMHSLHFLAYHIPGFCAGLYWATLSKTMVSRSLGIIIPVICMIGFISHPVGFYAAPYTLYWFIPLLIQFTQKRSIFMAALASTFIAHAVGSVIWIYTVPMTAAAWYALIPVVAIERLLFATGMVVCYYAVNGIPRYIRLALKLRRTLGTSGKYKSAHGECRASKAKIDVSNHTIIRNKFLPQ